MIAPNLPEYQTCASEAVAIGKAAGVNIVDDLQYDVDASTITTQADNIVAKLAADSDTDVILLTDTVSPVLFTDRAEEQGYTPEWIEAGTLNTERSVKDPRPTINQDRRCFNQIRSLDTWPESTTAETPILSSFSKISPVATCCACR